MSSKPSKPLTYAEGAVSTFLDNHRGPFKFCVTRPFATKPGFFRSEWLSRSTGETSYEIEEEALALLNDPRDTIVGVDVWSTSEQCFIGGYKRRPEGGLQCQAPQRARVFEQKS